MRRAAVFFALPVLAVFASPAGSPSSEAKTIAVTVDDLPINGPYVGLAALERTKS